MLKDLKDESRSQPVAHHPHLVLVCQLTDVVHHEFEVEDHQDEEGILEFVFTIVEVVLKTEYHEEEKVVDKVAQEHIELLVHVLTAEFLIRRQVLHPLHICDWHLIWIIEINLDLWFTLVSAVSSPPLNLLLILIILLIT